jgi:hypothetical protein
LFSQGGDTLHHLAKMFRRDADDEADAGRSFFAPAVFLAGHDERSLPLEFADDGFTWPHMARVFNHQGKLSIANNLRCGAWA